MAEKPTIVLAAPGARVVHYVSTSLLHYLGGERPHPCYAEWQQVPGGMRAECPHQIVVYREPAHADV